MTIVNYFPYLICALSLQWPSSGPRGTPTTRCQLGGWAIVQPFSRNHIQIAVFNLVMLATTFASCLPFLAKHKFALKYLMISCRRVVPFSKSGACCGPQKGTGGAWPIGYHLRLLERSRERPSNCTLANPLQLARKLELQPATRTQFGST